MNPQEAFLNLLVGAMNDAAKNGALTQLQTQIMPEGRTKSETIRIIVIPEKMPFNWPKYAPLGTPHS